MQDWKMTDKILANSGQNYGVWKMQGWKMTDSILANSEQNYGVWKIQDWKMTDRLYAKWLSAVSYTYWHGYACVFLMCIWRTIVRHFSNFTNYFSDHFYCWYWWTIMKILLDTCACIFYISDNVIARVYLANDILVHIIMLLFKSQPVYRQLKKVSKKRTR